MGQHHKKRLMAWSTLSCYHGGAGRMHLSSSTGGRGWAQGWGTAPHALSPSCCASGGGPVPLALLLKGTDVGPSHPSLRQGSQPHSIHLKMRGHFLTAFLPKCRGPRSSRCATRLPGDNRGRTPGRAQNEAAHSTVTGCQDVAMQNGPTDSGRHRHGGEPGKEGEQRPA